VVLDGVVPPGWVLGATLRADAQRAMQRIFERCAAEPACRQAFPDLAGDLDSLVKNLDKDPQNVSLPDPTTDSPRQVKVDGQVAGAMLRLISYSSEYTALIPWLLHTAARGNLAPLAAQYLIANRPGGSGGIVPGLFYAVVCSEDVPFLPGGDERGAFFFYDPLPVFRAACSAYPSVPQSAAERSFPPGLQTPALIISGDADPVTPPANGDAVLKLLPNARHVVLPGMAHGNLIYGCMPNLVASLFEKASPAQLDLSCTGRIAPLPFFTSAVGPEP
jgi:pimeloyl-ACP methyl ester carboxylesterase